MSIPIHRVLVVEDCPVDGALITAQLESLHKVVEVRLVSDPEVAIDVAEEFCPELVVLDLHLPPVSGLEVLQGLKKQARHEAAKMVLLSGGMNDKHRQKARQLGAEDCYTKPSSLLFYRELARELLDQHLA